MILDGVSAFLLLAGAAFSLIGGLGILRLPDFFARIHGAGLTDTLGAGLILTGLMFLSPHWLVTVKLVAILFFLWITSPTATHALANAALAAGLRPRVADEGEDA